MKGIAMRFGILLLFNCVISLDIPPEIIQSFTIMDLAAGQVSSYQSGRWHPLIFSKLQAQCEIPRQGTEIYCESRQTNSVSMMIDPSTNQTRLIDSDADAYLYSTDFSLACLWNASTQQCQYRCNWLYQFGSTLVSEKISTIRNIAHYVFQNYGAGCTAFNTKPSRNGNRPCTICEDPNFNPPECSDIPKYPDCLTRCNMLPNCTTLCQNVLISGSFETDIPVDDATRHKDAFLACCTPMRMQINGETERLSTESCIREYYLMMGLDMTSSRNRSCIETQKKYENYPRTTDYCSTEICYFRMLEQNITEMKDRWVESAMTLALQTDCVDGSCGILTSVASAEDGQLAIALVSILFGPAEINECWWWSLQGNTAMLGSEPSQRFRTALDILLGLLPYDALLTLETARLAYAGTGGDPDTVNVLTIPFNVYQKSCPVSAPCSLQEGVLLRNLEVRCCLLHSFSNKLCWVYWSEWLCDSGSNQTKYLIMFRTLLATGRY